MKKSENFRGTGNKRSRLFMVRNRYCDPLRNEPAGKYKPTNKQKATLSESFEDQCEFLLPSMSRDWYEICCPNSPSSVTHFPLPEQGLPVRISSSFSSSRLARLKLALSFRFSVK